MRLLTLKTEYVDSEITVSAARIALHHQLTIAISCRSSQYILCPLVPKTRHTDERQRMTIPVNPHREKKGKTDHDAKKVKVRSAQ